MQQASYKGGLLEEGRGVRTWEGVEAGEWTCRQADRSRAMRAEKMMRHKEERGREKLTENPWEQRAEVPCDPFTHSLQLKHLARAGDGYKGYKPLLGPQEKPGEIAYMPTARTFDKVSRGVPEVPKCRSAVVRPLLPTLCSAAKAAVDSYAAQAAALEGTRGNLHWCLCGNHRIQGFFHLDSSKECDPLSGSDVIVA